MKKLLSMAFLTISFAQPALCMENDGTHKRKTEQEDEQALSNNVKKIKLSPEQESLNAQLLSAIQRDNSDTIIATVTNLLQQGAEVNACDKEGNTPLHNACFKANRTLAQLLIDSGADVNAQNTFKRTPLHELCRNSYPTSASKTRIHIFQSLLAQKANLNMPDKNGRTPLFDACANLNLNLLLFMVDNGAHINAQDEEQETILHKKYHYSSDTTTRLLEILINKGAWVNSANVRGETPLHMVSSNPKYIDIALLFIDKGALIDAQDKDHTTPLHRACDGNNDQLISYILLHGPKPVAWNKKKLIIAGHVKNKGDSPFAQLPAEIIIHILSFLSHTKKDCADAVRNLILHKDSSGRTGFSLISPTNQTSLNSILNPQHWNNANHTEQHYDNVMWICKQNSIRGGSSRLK